MATKIRLKRIGRRNRPFYRVVVMDSRNKRDGAAIEELGLIRLTQIRLIHLTKTELFIGLRPELNLRMHFIA